MKFSKLWLAGAASLALVACGKKDDAADAPKTQASAQAAKTNAASPLASDFRLKGAEPVDIDALFALMPPPSTPTYDSAEFDKRLGATVVTNLRFSDADDGEAVVIKRAEFFGVDMAAIERIKSASDAGNDAKFETVFEKVRLLDVSAEGIDDDKAKMSIGGVEFDKLEVRQGGFDGDGTGSEPARFFNAISLAGLYFKDVSFGVEEGDGPSMTFSAPDLRFVGLSGGKLEAMIANDFDYEMTQTDQSLAALSSAMGPQGAMLFNGPLRGLFAPENQRTTMETLEWRNIDFSGLMAWGLKDEEPPMTARDLIDFGTMKATGMATLINGRTAMTVDEATISAAEFTWVIPSKIRADTKGAVYDFTAYVPESEEATIKILNDHKLNKVKGDGYLEWVWNADNGNANLDYIANTDGLADLSMAMGFSALKLKEMAAAKEDGEDNAFAALGAFNNFSLKIKDENALDAIFAISALQMGGTGDDLRQSAPALIRLSGAQAAQLNPRISDYVDALADFVAKGGSLEISAEPKKPVAFSTLQSSAIAPQTLPDVLDIKVTHQK